MPPVSMEELGSVLRGISLLDALTLIGATSIGLAGIHFDLLAGQSEWYVVPEAGWLFLSLLRLAPNALVDSQPLLLSPAWPTGRLLQSERDLGVPYERGQQVRSPFQGR